MAQSDRSRSGASLAMLAALAGLGLAPTAAAAQGADLVTVPPVPRDYRPATTAWGEPDLRGTLPIDHLNFTTLQRTVEQGTRYWLNDEEWAARQQTLAARGAAYANEIEADRLGGGHWVEPGTANRRTSFVIDPPNGRLPELTAEGKRRQATKRSSYIAGQSYDSPADFDTWDRCITRGLPASMFPFNYNNGIRLFQAPGLVAIQMEMVHETRLIPTDGRPGIPVQIQNWLGESRGRWENGNTLVVETTNLRPGPSATNIGTTGSPPENDTPVSERARLTERFTMTGPDSIVYEFTWDDPVVFTAPWTARLDWVRDDDFGIYEYACHEGNVQIRNFITASRAERADAAAQAAGTP